MRKFLIIITLLLISCGTANNAMPSPTPPPTASQSTPITSAPELVWQAAFDGIPKATPQLGGGHVIVATETAVTALNPQNGEIAWQVKPENGVWRRAIAASDEMVVVGVPNAVLALDAASGEILWQQAIEGDLLWPARILENDVYLGSAFVGPDSPPQPEGKGWVYRLDKSSGEVIWAAETAAYSLVTPVVHDDWVIVAGSLLDEADVNEGGHLRIHAFAADDGRLRWQIDRTDGFMKTLAVDDQHLYFAAYTDMVFGLRLENGEEVWRYPTENWSPGFVYADGTLFFGSDNAFVHAVDGESGEVVWKRPLTGIFNAPRSPLVAVGDYLYFQSNDNRLYCLQKSTGEVVWQTEPQPRSLFTPAIGYDHLFLIGRDGILYAYQSTRQ